MTIVSLRTSDAGGGTASYASQSETSPNCAGGTCTLWSSDNPANRKWIGLRFAGVPTDLTAENLRQARFQWCGNNNTNNDGLGTLYGHKHVASANFANNDFGTGNRDIVHRTLTDAHLHWNGIDTAPYIPFNFPEGDPDLFYDVLMELLSMPGRAPGAPITLIFKPDSTPPDYHWNGTGAAEKEFQPLITINYGEVSSDPVEIDLYTSGDSTMAYTGNSGFDRGSLQIALFKNITFQHCAAGMGPDQGYGALNAGDRIRGYCPGGIYHRELDRRYGDELVMYTHEHAIADTLAAQWYANITAESEYFWGDITKPGSFRFDLAHPNSEHQVVLINLGPNDLIAYGSNHFVWGHGTLDPETNHEQWREWTFDNVLPYMEAIFEEIRRCVEVGGNNPNNCWIFITGYPNHCVIDKVMTNPNGTTFLPDGASNQYFRAVWCMGDGHHNQLGILRKQSY